MTLATFIYRYNLDPIACMNDLQDYGIISDLPVLPQDVHQSEHITAIFWLKQTARKHNLYATTNQRARPR